MKKDIKYHNTFDQIKTEETKPKTTISIDEAKNIVKKNEDSQIKYLTDKIEKIQMLTQKPLENIKYIISDLETTKIEVHESSFEPLVINSKKMVVNSIKKELSSSIPKPKTLNDVIKFYERLDSMVNKFSEISMSHKKVFNFFISKYADKLKTEFENISSLSMQCKYELDVFEKERQPIKICLDNIDTLIQKNESIKLEEEKYKMKQSQRDELKLKIKKVDDEIQDLINSKHFIEANDIMKKIESLEIEKNNHHKELLNIFSKTSRAFNKYSYGLNKSIVHKIHIILEQPWIILQDLDAYLDLIKEVKSAIIKGTIILKDSDKIETHLDNIINSLPNFKEREEKLNDEIKKLNNNKNINIISKVNELKRKKANYNQEFKDIELYIKESENELLKNKSESNDLLSSIETYINHLSKIKYRISISK
ncbi:MAG TPA: hypothetical protein VFM28_12120 [Nitrososphaeraceae archaeon]|nr:hypothetical protein [Nitrososphaeraceae archaeon]